MDDLISRQAAIDKAILIPIAKIVTEDEIIYRKAVFVDDIEKIPSAQQWIPRSERLPEEGKRVIVQYGDGSLGVIERVRLKIWNLINTPYAKVVAWMPAPEPWGDEDEQLC